MIAENHMTQLTFGCLEISSDLFLFKPTHLHLPVYFEKVFYMDLEVELSDYLLNIDLETSVIVLQSLV